MFLLTILFSILGLASGLYNARGQLLKKDHSNVLTINLATNGDDYPELISWPKSFSCQQIRQRKDLFDSLSLHTSYQCYLKSEYQYDMCPDLVQASDMLASFALSADDKVSLKSTIKMKTASKACDNKISFQYNLLVKKGWISYLFNIITLGSSGGSQFRSVLVSLTAIVVSFLALYPLYSNKIKNKVIRSLREKTRYLKKKLLKVARYIELDLGWFNSKSVEYKRPQRNHIFKKKRRKDSNFKFNSIDRY